MTGDEFRSTVASYDLVAADYARVNATLPAEVVERQAEFAALAGDGGLVADLGCGPGRDAAALRERGLRVCGFDASASMAGLARAESVPVALADHRRPPIATGVLDGVWSSASLLHVPRADVPATLRQWRRCLRTGGVLGLSTSLGGSEGWEDVPYAPSAHPEEDGLRRWFVHHDRDDLLRLVAGAGFAVRDVAERIGHRHWLWVLATAE